MAPLCFDKFIELLSETSAEECLPAVDVLLKCTSNILNHPNETKYRRLKIGSRDFMERLIPVKGALECLFFAGFEEGSDYLIYPEEASTEPLLTLQDSLIRLREELRQKQQQCPKTSAGSSWDNKIYPNDIEHLEREFHVRISSSCDLVQLYEDSNLQQKARSCIPVEKLSEKAKLCLEDILSQKSSTSCRVGFNDCLLVELLDWFKKDFFSWFSTPCCTACNKAMASVGHIDAQPDEVIWGGNRVEGYQCAVCGTSSRFPRYNHPSKLLETRVGRCGEWANCFTLCCISLGLEARYVLDWTDHVWTEVYSNSQGRWLHCDPCENVCDSPLLYESGWSKKLSYVLAFAKDNLQDVTWRYSASHADVLRRRLLCRETWLLGVILERRQRLQAGLDPARQRELGRRLVVELVEFLTPRQAKESETGGRVSGAYEWRRRRGEVGESQVSRFESIVLSLTEDEMSAKQFHLKYCAATDTYFRPSTANCTPLDGWLSCVYVVSNVFRKVELDWNQVYLARTEGSDVGMVSWKVSVPSSDVQLRILSVTVRCDSKVYENGAVLRKICAQEKCIKIPEDQVSFTSQDFAGERELIIVAELSKGTGNVSWQHAQLFRQPLSETNVFPFEVFITFE